MRVSGPSSTKIFLPALLAMATVTLQAQQTSQPQAPASTTAPASQTAPPATTPPATSAPTTGAPTTPDTSKPTTGTATDGTNASAATTDAKDTPATATDGKNAPTAPQSTPANAPASTQTNPPAYDNAKDNGKKDKKNKKDKDAQDSKDNQPTAEEMAAAQDTAIRARKNTAPEPLPNGVMPGVKKGSIDDVSATGTRDIGGRGLGNWYSTESEMKEGKGISMEIERSVKFINDPMVTEYVNRIGQNIVKNSDAKVPFTIRVIDSDEINAMALPGGFFYVNSGLILAADDEAELAGVMAHEIAHVAAHHAMREQTRMNYAQMGTIPLIFVGGGLGYGLYEAASLAVPITFLQFSRDFERQADFLGIEYMYRAGYDPQALPSMFEKIEHLEKTKPNMIAKAFSDHPQTPDRILATQQEIAHLLPPKDEYVITTSEFDDVKARLARIENKRKLRDGQQEKKPSLRHASTSPDANGQNGQQTSQNGQNNPNGQNGSDDDRPTLHRRDN
jgi:beta-barrel assembly-enhancing protease